MQTLTIGWEYLTGYSVATDPSTRDRPEWPPHPARVFMALAAALFETDPDPTDESAFREWSEERQALRFLEALPEPELILPELVEGAARSNVTYYVPVNDSAGPHSATIQSCPSLARSRQPRTFPRTWIGDQPCLLRWDSIESIPGGLDALDRLCRKVTRLGHSSSLVRMWARADDESPSQGTSRFIPDDVSTDVQVRSITRNMLPMLEQRFGGEDRTRHERIAELEATKKTLKGKGAAERKAEIDREIEQLRTRLISAKPRPPARPSVGIWSGYRRVGNEATAPERTCSYFDTDIVFLTHDPRSQIPAATTTLLLTSALRGAILSRFGDEPIPDWVTGHSSEGAPLRNPDGHLALIPLPFVGHAHADGHLLGLGMVFPRSVPRVERGRVLRRLFRRDADALSNLKLHWWGGEHFEFRPKDHDERRASLQPETWTASPNGSETWASVTPVVLDRFPKADRRNPAERLNWESEVRSIVAESCRRIGLPAPDVIDIGTTCPHLGGPRSLAKRRPLLGDDRTPAGDARFGDGYPAYPAKGGNASRPQVHVYLEFPVPVVGPVLIGAGRFLGYGVCKPLGRRD